MDIKALKAKAQTIRPAVQIGKAGITPGSIAEIKKQLKKKKIIKIKLLKSFLEDYDKKQAAETLAKETNSLLVMQIGGAITLAKK